LFKNIIQEIETTGTTDGKTRGDKHTIKMTETTGTTDGKTAGDKHTIKKTETVFIGGLIISSFCHQ
jgi:hypothetical protein